MKRIRVAVLGYGHLGKWHCQKVEAHSESVDFVAIVEKFSPSQTLARQNHPNVRVVENIEEIISEIDAAFIVTPTSTHCELMTYLLNQGKHVFCEKPVCSNDHEAERLLALAREKNVVIQVGHSERFHQAWNLIGEKLKKLRTPYRVRINRVAAFKGRATDVDVIQDLAIHDLDLILYLLNQRPLSVKAEGYKIRTQKLDHASIELELESNCSAEITVSRNHVKEIRDFEVISQDGMIYVNLMNNKILEAHSSSFEDGSFVKELNYEKRDHLLLEHKYFYQSIMKNESPVVTIADGLNAVHLVDLSLQSVEQGKKMKVQFYA
jgi:predicted dehydrogenase